MFKKYKMNVFQSPINGNYYWNVQAKNGEIVNQSEGYTTQAMALKTAKNVRGLNLHWPINVLVGMHLPK